MTDLVMGFDFGTQKIGIAIGQALTGTATPLGIVRANQGKPNWADIEKLVNEWQPVCFVVGLPLNMDATASDMSNAAERFARRLSGRYGIPAETMDERLSSFEVKHARPNQEVDDLAAVVILESWFRTK
jgi:putative holliday junction resolvase